MSTRRILNFVLFFVILVMLKTGIEAIGGKQFFAYTKWMFLFLGVYLVLKYVRLKTERDQE